jgi:RNA polymerase sigma-70 factor (ECF subfamily)
MSIAEDSSSLLLQEAGLVDRLKQRSNPAWAALYDDHYTPLYRYVFARTSDATVAADLASDTFSEALKSIDSYQHRGKPILAWLYRIAHNLVANHFRQQKRTAAEPIGAIPADSAKLADAGGDPSAKISGVDVRQALGGIKGSHREIIILHYYLGLTLPETAQLLGKKERAVYSLHERAIIALRREIGRNQ